MPHVPYLSIKCGVANWGRAVKHNMKLGNKVGTLHHLHCVTKIYKHVQWLLKKVCISTYNRCCCILLCFPGKHSTFFTQIVVMQTCACIIGAIRAILVSNPRAKRFQITPELPSNRRRVLAPLWPTQRRAFLPETSDNPWRMVRMKSPAWFRIAQPPPTKQPSGKHEAAGIWKLDVSVTADFQIFPV